MKRAIAWLIGWACLTTASGAIDLERFLDEVKAANPGVAAAKQRYAAQSHRIRPAATWEDPFIAAGTDQNPFGGMFGSAYRYQLNQTIPFPGKLDARGKAAEATAKNLLADSEMFERETIISATQIFYQAVMNERALQLNSDYAVLLKDAAASEKIRYNTGTGGHHLWLLATAELDILRTERLRLQKEQKQLIALMNELRNQPADTEFAAFEFSPEEPTQELPVFEEVIARQPEYRSALARNSFAAESNRQSKQGYLPDFMLQGMVMQSNMDSQPSNWGAMIGVTMPLYWWRKQSELVKASELEMDAAEKDRIALLNRLKAEWADAQRQLSLAREVHNLYQSKILPVTKMAVDSARTDYRTRKLNLRELTDTMRIYKKQELEALAARLDIELARLRLKELVANPSLVGLTPRTPTLFNGSMPAMSDTGMSTNPPMRPGSGMRPPKQGVPQQKGSSMGGM